MGPDLWELFEDGKEDDEVAAIIRLGHYAVVPKGVRVVTQFNEIITVRIKRGDLLKVSGAPEVDSMVAGDAYLGADLELETAGLPELSSDTILPSDERRPKDVAATGRGVVVGVVDWGFDFAHPDFRNKDGSTRIVALWDQRGSRRPGSPQPFGYGIIHDREAINRALKSKDPYAALGYHPADADTGIGCHGTHVASIAAGSGGEDSPTGIAPEADFVLVHNSPWDEAETSKLGDSVTLLEGIDFISRTAGERPWVINLSMGRHGEQHDGSTLIEQGLDAAIRSTPGRAVCLSAGNYYNKKVHASGQLRPTQERTLVWEIVEGKPTYNQMEFWYSWQDKFELAVRSPDGTIAARVKVGERAKFLVGGKEVGNVYHRTQEPNNLDNHITVYLYKEAPAGAWEVTLIGTDVIDGRYHAWIERDVTCPKCQSRFRPDDADPRSTTGTICNGRRSIAVGAYDYHDPEKRIGPFSSVGPTRDGRLKPDLCAPGVAVLAARSTPRDPQANVPLLTRMNGTSMAAPHVTGTVALMFQAAPRRLRIEETHNLLLENASRVPEGVENPDRYGIGFLDIVAAVEAARKVGGVTSTFKQVNVQTLGAGAAKPKGPEMEITEMGERATCGRSQPHASSEGAEAEELVMSMPATEETPHAARRNLLLVCGGPGPYDNRDVEHDQSWANYVTPPLLLAKDKKPPFDVHNEDVHWLIYKTAYERRWKDDSSSSNAVRKKAIKEVVDKGFSSYVDELEHRAKEHKWDLTWLTSAQDFWTKLTSFPPHSISRVYYWGHARDDLWLALKHSGHIAVAPEPSEIITESSIDCKLATLFRKDSDRVHRFIGCNTAKFAKKWGEIFAVPAEGVQEKINFGAIHHTGGEPCLVGSAAVQLFNKDGELTTSGATKLTQCDSSAHESLAEGKAETIEVADTPVAFAPPSATSEYSPLSQGNPLVETADEIVRGASQRNPEAILHEMMLRQNSEGLSDGSDRALPTAREVFDSFTFPRRGGLREQLEQHFEVVALPGELLESGLREADVLVRRIDGDWAHVSVVASPRLMNMEALRSEGLTPETGAAGNYAQVVESGARPHTCSDGFARRVTDKWGRMPGDQLVLRPRIEFNTQSEVELEAEAEDASEDDNDLGPADSIDQAAAQPPFSSAVRNRMEALLDVKSTEAAVTWNKARHPEKSEIEVSVLRTRLGAYLDIDAVERAMQSSAELKHIAGDPGAVVAVAAHQFQQKIYASKAQRDGKIGEGTLDALGFVRHRDDSLNRVDKANQFHVKNDSKAFQRIKKVYVDHASVFEELGSDVTPRTWFRLFVNAPFLGRPITNGVHFELMRKLRRAEAWLATQRQYRDMSPVELGSALGIDEDHHGSRPLQKESSSMHTLGLAVDIGYLKNPWVAGQHKSPERNKHFKEVSMNVSRLMEGIEEELTPEWLQHLGAGSSFTTQAAYLEIQKRSSNFKAYLALEHDPASLKELLKKRTSGPGGQKFLGDGESIDRAVKRWQEIIDEDRKHLKFVFGEGRRAEAGFLNLHRDLVVALRDHGCLAWGAIDLGEHESGDMMHFDCRPAGVGYQLALPAQQRAAEGHPCAAEKTGTKPKSLSHPAGSSATSASAAPPKNFRGGLLWEFTSVTLPLKVAVFVPPAARMQKAVDVLCYAHGLLDRCHPIPEDLLGLITDPPFKLGEVVDASHRNVILAVPYFAWGHLGKLAHSQQRPRWHALGNPANLNAVIAQVLAEVGRKQGIPAPTIRHLILAGHSKAYDFLNPLAHSHADPEMSSGALARLSQVWALDSTYSFPADDLQAWMASKPELTVEVIFRKDSQTDRGSIFTELVKRSKSQLKVLPVSDGHCDLPKRRLPDLLNSLSSSEGVATEGCEGDLNEFSLDLVELADQIVSECARQRAPAPILHEMLSRTGIAEALTIPGEGRLPSAAEIFDAFAYPSRGGLRQQLEQHFEIVALPQAPMGHELREGDLMMRRGDGDTGYFSVIATPKLRSLEALLSEGMTPESFNNGNFAQVVETGARPHSRSDQFARQLTDSAGRLLNDILLLRLAAPPTVINVQQPSKPAAEPGIDTEGSSLAEDFTGADYGEDEFELLHEQPLQERFDPSAIPKNVADVLGKKDWPLALKLAIQAGWRGQNELTDVIFFARHPELPPAKLDPKGPNFKQLSGEWSRILDREVWKAIQASAENTALAVSGEEVADHDRFFWGNSGKRLKELVEDAAKEVDLNPGLLGAIMMAETRRPQSYLSSEKVSSYHIGTDDFYEGRTAIAARVPAYAKVKWDKNQTPFIHHNDARTPREVKDILFDSGPDAVLATAVYVKFREVRLREVAAELKGDFDHLPLETRFALTRMAMAAGTAGVTPLLRDALAGKDILIRKAIPVEIYQTQRNATVRTAQAIHLSDWIFGNRLAPASQPEVEESDGWDKTQESAGEGESGGDSEGLEFEDARVEGETDNYDGGSREFPAPPVPAPPVRPGTPECPDDARLRDPLQLPEECLKRLEGTHVAVVGAGLAGLMAARRLRQHRVRVTVFEARHQVGGRVLSNIEFSSGRITEEGAELIGSFHTTWLALAREYGLAVISRMDQDLHYQRAGLSAKLTLDKPLCMNEIIELEKAMNTRVLKPIADYARQIADPSQPWKQETTLKAYDISVADALVKYCKVDKHKDERLWKRIEHLLVNNEVAPLEEMNFLGLLCKVKGGQGPRFGSDPTNLMGYWEELEIFRCADGCQTLARKIAEEIQTDENEKKPKKHPAELRLRTAVTDINLSKQGVALRVKAIKSDGKFADGPPVSIPHRYDYVILAIPPSVWADVKITADGRDAHPKDEIGLMGMGPAVKFFSEVKERFWIKGKAAPFGGSLRLGQVWEGTDNQTRVGKQGIVLSVFAGPVFGGRRVPTPGEFEAGLKLLYPGYARNLNRPPLFSDWPNVPFIKTGYASPRNGQIFTIGKKLSESFRDRMFFAGEHTQMDFFGYMEGALRSGERAAEKLMLQSCDISSYGFV